MHLCPVCTMDLNRTIADVLRKVDVGHFDCPMCETPLVASAVRTITIAKDPERQQPSPTFSDGTAIFPARDAERIERCHAGKDGECFDSRCPQLRDGEPEKTGRHCPLDTWGDDD